MRLPGDKTQTCHVFGAELNCDSEGRHKTPVEGCASGLRGLFTEIHLNERKFHVQRCHQFLGLIIQCLSASFLTIVHFFSWISMNHVIWVRITQKTHQRVGSAPLLSQRYDNRVAEVRYTGRDEPLHISIDIRQPGLLPGIPRDDPRREAFAD